MKKLLWLSIAVFMCGQSLTVLAKKKDKAWIVNALGRSWLVTASSSVMKEEEIDANKPREVNVGNKDYHVTVTQGANCGINECVKQGTTTTNINKKGVYEISNAVDTGQKSWTGTKDVLIQNVTFARLDDATAASRYPNLKY